MEKPAEVLDQVWADVVGSVISQSQCVLVDLPLVVACQMDLLHRV